MIGSGGAAGTEEGAAVFDGAQKTLPASGVFTRQFADALHAGGELVVVRVGDLVGPQGRHHPAFPAGSGDRVVMRQRVYRMFGCGDYLDVEALEQGPRP